MRSEISLLAFFTVCLVVAQPPGGGGGAPPNNPGAAGSAVSTACTAVVGTCQRDGSSNYMSRSLTYDAATGFFNGSFISNACPETYLGKYSGVAAAGYIQFTPYCYRQPIPATGYVGVTFPQVLPTRGTSGFTIAGGIAIYGPMEAGFAAGQACNNNKGFCAGGMDVATCESKLRHECGTDFLHERFADDCGGHATPFHYHSDVKCTKSGYSGAALAAVHSPLIGVMLDGRGLYGMYESGTTKPTDLDACGGHLGFVPASTVSGLVNDTYAASSVPVYHYHTQSVAPYVPACFGPVDTLAACKSLYSTCALGSASETICTEKGSLSYQYDCPCFQNMKTNETFNQNFTLPCVTTGSSIMTAPSVLVILGLLMAKLYV